MLYLYLLLLCQGWLAAVCAVPSSLRTGDVLHSPSRRSLEHRSADNTIDLAASGNVPLVFNTAEIIDLLNITTNVHAVNDDHTTAKQLSTRGLTDCGIGKSLWKRLSTFDYTSWIFYAAGASAGIPSALRIATSIFNEATNLIMAYRTFVHTYNTWTPNNGGSIHRDAVSIKFDLAGHLGPNLTVSSADYGVSTYVYDSAAQTIELLGITTATPPQYNGSKRDNWYSLVSAFAPYGSYSRIAWNDMAYAVKDMMTGTWSNGGESCFSQQWSQETSKDFYTSGGLCAQFSTYSNNDVDNLWGNCCGINRGAPWTDCGWAAYDDKGDGCNGK